MDEEGHETDQQHDGKLKNDYDDGDKRTDHKARRVIMPSTQAVEMELQSGAWDRFSQCVQLERNWRRVHGRSVSRGQLTKWS